MLPPPILVVVGLSPLPIVAVDVDTVLWLELIFLFRVPTVAFLVANDRCRCACRRQRKYAEDPQRHFLSFFIISLSFVFSLGAFPRRRRSPANSPGSVRLQRRDLGGQGELRRPSQWLEEDKVPY